MTASDDRDELLQAVQARRGPLNTFLQHWHGTAPAAYLSKETRKDLDNRVSRLGVNFPRLVVESLTERLRIAGIDRDGRADESLGKLWASHRVDVVADQAHTDRLLYGDSAVTVWVQDGQPTVTADSPLTVYAETDPATGETERAVRCWSRTSPDGRGRTVAIVWTPDQVNRWDTDSADIATASPASWRNTQTLDNPLGVVPVVPLTRIQSAADTDGVSAVADILDLTDAVAKVLADALVTSEFYARPRRWATGLEIQEDQDGNPIDPFAEMRFLQNESPEGRFGQLDPVDVSSYSALLASLTQQIGAMTGLPPHYIGLHGDQPANADSVRAAEAQLTSRAYAEIRQLTGPWAKVVALLESVATGQASDPSRITPRFENPEMRTPGQAADAATKLADIGIPLETIMRDTLGWDQATIADASRNVRRNTLDRSGLSQLPDMGDEQ